MLLIAFHAYLRYLFITRYNCLCFISMFALGLSLLCSKIAHYAF